MTITPTTVRELHEHLTGGVEATVVSLADARDTREVRDVVIELRFPQRLRAVAAGAVFAECRPHFTEDDEEYVGLILGQLAGWVLYGEAYDPDLGDKVVMPRGTV